MVFFLGTLQFSEGVDQKNMQIKFQALMFPPRVGIVPCYEGVIRSKHHLFFWLVAMVRGSA